MLKPGQRRTKGQRQREIAKSNEKTNVDRDREELTDTLNQRIKAHKGRAKKTEARQRRQKWSGRASIPQKSCFVGGGLALWAEPACPAVMNWRCQDKANRDLYSG